MESPLVSIVTPSYNQAPFLETTIRSVLDQDYPRIEYLVVDGGSTDGSLEIIRRYVNRLAYWVSEPDAGQADAINKGWRRARGSILAYVNSDDTYLPGAIRTAVELLARHPSAGVLYGDALYIGPDGNVMGRYAAGPFHYRDAVLCGVNPIPQPAAFIRREVIDRIGYLDAGLYGAIDLDLWVRAGLHFQLMYVPVTLATFRLHPDSKSVGRTAKAVWDFPRIYSNLLSNPALPSDLRRAKRRLMSRAYLLAAGAYDTALDLRGVRKMVLRAWTLYPPTVGPRQYAKFALSCLGGLGEHLLKRVREGRSRYAQ